MWDWHCKMANYQIMQRTDSLADIEKGVKNKWVWGWCESPDANCDYLSDHIRKVNLSGAAICQCNKKISYGNGGKTHWNNMPRSKYTSICSEPGRDLKCYQQFLKLLQRNHLWFLKLKIQGMTPFFIVAKKKNLSFWMWHCIKKYKKQTNKQANKRQKKSVPDEPSKWVFKG